MKQLRMQTIHDLADRSLLAKYEQPKSKESFKDGYLSGFFDAYAMYVKGVDFEVCPKCGRLDNWGIGGGRLECICNHVFSVNGSTSLSGPSDIKGFIAILHNLKEAGLLEGFLEENKNLIQILKRAIEP